MKSGFKCDFCFEFKEEKQQMVEHELGCKYNPINKKCSSCKFRNKSLLMEGSCNNNYDWDFQDGVADGVIKCSEYTDETCPECNGKGKIIWSCCNDNISENFGESDICPTCGEHCGESWEKCDKCNGIGKIF